MQFVPWTWNWVAETYDLPMWDEWVILRWGRPYDFKGKTYRTNMGFEQIRVQYSPYYNILFASILAEDIYGRTQWRDWNSSKWCWEDVDKWERKWKAEISQQYFVVYVKTNQYQVMLQLFVMVVCLVQVTGKMEEDKSYYDDDYGYDDLDYELQTTTY